MQNYSWPGNVRELRNTIERVVIMNPGIKVTAGDLPPHGKEEAPAASFRFPSFKEATDAYHREFIQRKLDEAEGNVSRAAELMGVDRSHFIAACVRWGFPVAANARGFVASEFS